MFIPEVDGVESVKGIAYRGGTWSVSKIGILASPSIIACPLPSESKVNTRAFWCYACSWPSPTLWAGGSCGVWGSGASYIRVWEMNVLEGSCGLSLWTSSDMITSGFSKSSSTVVSALSLWDGGFCGIEAWVTASSLWQPGSYVSAYVDVSGS